VKIYCDLDSVLCNLSKAVNDLTGLKLRPGVHIHLGTEVWDKIDKAGSDFWAQLEWMPGGKELWEAIKGRDVTILSSPSRHNSSHVGKREWVARELGKHIPVILERRKERYATPDAILIDDLRKNIDLWVRAGGIGVLHTNTPDTIERLNELLGMEKEAFKIMSVRSPSDPSRKIIVEKLRGGRGTQVMRDKKKYDRRKEKGCSEREAGYLRVVASFMSREASVHPIYTEIANDLEREKNQLRTRVQALQSTVGARERAYLLDNIEYGLRNVRRGDKDEIARVEYNLKSLKHSLGVGNTMEKRAYVTGLKFQSHPVIIDPYDAIVQQAVQQMGAKATDIDVIKLEVSCPGDRVAWVTNEDFFKGEKGKKRVVHLCLKKIQDQFKKAHGKGFDMTNAKHTDQMRELVVSYLRDVVLPHEGEHIQQEMKGNGEFGSSSEPKAERAENWSKLEMMGIAKKAGFFPEGYNPETGKWDRGTNAPRSVNKPLRRETPFSFKRLSTQNLNYVKSALIGLKDPQATKIWNYIESGVQGDYPDGQEDELRRLIEQEAREYSLSVGELVNNLFRNKSIDDLRSSQVQHKVPREFARKVVMRYASSKTKKLILLRGVSGAGKSTLAKQLENQYGAKTLSSDDYFMVGGRYVHSVDKIPAAHAWNKDRAEQAMANGEPVVIVDSVNSRAWNMKPYVEIARRYGYSVEILEPNWSPELRDERGHWNVDFLDKMQESKERTDTGKRVPRDRLQLMSDHYEYDVTEDDIMRSEGPKS